MKLVLIFTTAFLIFTAPAFSELTVKDLEKIGSIVKESENNVKEHVNLKVKNVSDKVDEMDKRMNIIFWVMMGLITLIAAAIGIPQIIMAWRGRSQRAADEKLGELQNIMQEMRKETQELQVEIQKINELEIIKQGNIIRV